MSHIVKLEPKEVQWHPLHKQGKQVPMELKPLDFKSCTVYLLWFFPWFVQTFVILYSTAKNVNAFLGWTDGALV